MRYDKASFAALRAELQKEADQALAQAKEAALLSGKEPFDLACLESAWRDNPDAYHEARGVLMSREWRLREWEHRYYCQFPAIRSLREFVERMKQLQAEGFFD